MGGNFSINVGCRESGLYWDKSYPGNEVKFGFWFRITPDKLPTSLK